MAASRSGRASSRRSTITTASTRAPHAVFAPRRVRSGSKPGLLIKSLRGRRAGPLARRAAATAAQHYGTVTAGVRLGLGAADLLHGIVGTTAMKGTLDGLRKVSGGRLPKWSPALARPIHFVPRARPLARAERLVYFPSCAARAMGPQRGDDGVEMLPVVAERLFRRAGFDVVYPARLDGLCCGQPFESKGLVDAADLKSTELEGGASRRQRRAVAGRSCSTPALAPIA
jgi:D-lactate dehydrogenase